VHKVLSNIILYIMLGWLVYEAIDVIYFTSKLGYNGIMGVYNWYSPIPEPEPEPKRGDYCNQEEIIEEFKRLNEKISSLETQINKDIANKLK